MNLFSLKVLGVLLLIGAGSGIGFYRAYQLKRRIADIIVLQNAVRLLETEIYYALTPLPQALEHLDEKFPVRIQPFFQQVRFAMQNSHMPVYQAWELAMQCLERISFCKEEELYALRSFGLSLGDSDIEEQKKNFQLLQHRLQHALELAEQICRKQERIWQYMGVCVSLAVALMLY